VSKKNNPKAKAAKPAAKKLANKKAQAKPSKPVVKKQTAKQPAKPTAKKTAAKPSKPALKKQAPKKQAPKKAVVKKPAPTTAKKPAPKKPAPPLVKKAAPQPVKKAAPAPAKKTALAPPAAKKPTAVAPPAAAKNPPVVKVAPGVIPVSAPAPAIAPAPPAPKPVSKAAKSLPPVKTVLSASASEPIAPPKPPVISSEKPAPTKSGALYYDSHMHTPLCKHATGEPEEYCAQALKSGMKGIIFTCHCPMPDGFWQSVRMSDGEFDIYTGLVERAKAAYKGKLDVCLGIESEYYPGYEKYIETLHQRAEFDYCLGGLHWQAKEYLAKFETGTIEGFRRTYFEHLAASAETGLYDCLAHPDLVKNYHPDSWCFAIIKNTVTSVLDRIAKTGVAMELNTSGLHKSYSEMNPGNEMLRMMAERKIPIVIGSDAHRSNRVGEHFITALNNLVEAGFEHVSYFKKRERIDLKIGDVISSIRRAADAHS
jgi:HisJ family histidinol phosphate phosphatase